MRKKYSISVIIPAYNAERFIAETLQCVNGQVRRPDEIVVVDDGSSDQTARVVQAWAAENRPDLKRVEQENRGASAARNTAIHHATGDLIATVDADDAVLPNHLEVLESGFHQRPDLVLCFADAQSYDPSTLDRESYLRGSRIAALECDVEPNGLRVIRGSAYPGIVGGSRIPTSATLYSREAALEVGLYNEALPQANDVEFLLRLSRVGAFGYYPIIVERLRRHESNLTHRRHRVANRKFKVAAYEGLLAKARALRLTDDERRLTMQARDESVDAVLYNASLQGAAAYFAQCCWACRRGYATRVFSVVHFLRAVKHSLQKTMTN